MSQGLFVAGQLQAFIFDLKAQPLVEPRTLQLRGYVTPLGFNFGSAMLLLIGIGFFNGVLQALFSLLPAQGHFLLQNRIATQDVTLFGFADNLANLFLE